MVEDEGGAGGLGGHGGHVDEAVRLLADVKRQPALTCHAPRVILIILIITFSPWQAERRVVPVVAVGVGGLRGGEGLGVHR